MSKITTINIRVPLWKAGTIRDKLAMALFPSTEEETKRPTITCSEHWTWRRPLTLEFTIIGPNYRAHKIAADAGAIGEVFYHGTYDPPRVEAALTIALCLALAGPVWAESDRGGTNGCGSCGAGATGGTANNPYSRYDQALRGDWVAANVRSFFSFSLNFDTWARSFSIANPTLGNIASAASKCCADDNTRTWGAYSTMAGKGFFRGVN